jgi:uncharacterized alpha-E superfamily protein
MGEGMNIRKARSNDQWIKINNKRKTINGKQKQQAECRAALDTTAEIEQHQLGKSSGLSLFLKI